MDSTVSVVQSRIVECLSEGILLLGFNGRVLYANQRASEILRIPMDKLLGEKFASLFFDDPDNDEFSQAVLECVYDKCIVDTVVNYTSGGRTYVLRMLTSFYSEGNQLSGVRAVFSDISELEDKYDITIERQTYIDFEEKDYTVRVMKRMDKVNLYKMSDGNDVERDDDGGYEMSLHGSGSSYIIVDYSGPVSEDYVRGLADLVKEQNLAEFNGWWRTNSEQFDRWYVNIEYASGENILMEASGRAALECPFSIYAFLRYADTEAGYTKELLESDLSMK